MGKRLVDGSIFLHIPKTGGTFVEHFLNSQNLINGPAGGKHDDLFRTLYPTDWKSRFSRVVSEFPEKVKNQLENSPKHDWTKGPRPEQPTLESLPYMFCFVRNPVSWIESYYRYVVRENWYYWSTEYDYYGFWHPNAVLNDLRSDTFNGFIEKLLNKRPGYVTELFGWYTTAGVRFIGKTENLREDLVSILEELKLPYDKSILLNMEKKNTSETQSNIVEWDPELKQEFIKTEYSGFKRYGYDIE